ncbi:MAG: hypothetical protein ACLPSL_13395, partial [Smithella sp.]
APSPTSRNLYVGTIPFVRDEAKPGHGKNIFRYFFPNFGMAYAGFLFIIQQLPPSTNIRHLNPS